MVLPGLCKKFVELSMVDCTEYTKVIFIKD
jgi:hypothetical protein